MAAKRVPKIEQDEVRGALGAMHDAVERVWRIVFDHASWLKQNRSSRDSLALWAARAEVSKATLTRVLEGERPKLEGLERLGRAIIVPGEDGGIVAMVNDNLALEEGLAALQRYPLVGGVVERFRAHGARIDLDEALAAWRHSGALDRMSITKVDAARGRLILVHRGAGLRYRAYAGPEIGIGELDMWRRKNYERGLKAEREGAPQLFFQEVTILRDAAELTVANFVATVPFQDAADGKLLIVTVSEARRD